MPRSNRPSAGFECKLFLSTVAASAYSANTLPAENTRHEIVNARDVSLPEELEEIDASARGDATKRVLAGMKEKGVEFEYRYVRGGDGADPVFDLLAAAKDSREPIVIIASDGPLDEEGVIWEQDWFEVTNFSRSEDMGNIRLYEVTLKPGVMFHNGAQLKGGMGEVPAP